VSAQPLIRVAAGVIEDAHGRVLIARRPQAAHAGGYWEFPGGKITGDETPVEGLVRELREELGIVVEAATPVTSYRHTYPERVVELHVFRVLGYAGEPRAMEGQPLRWVAIAELGGADLLPADRPIIEALRPGGIATG